VSLSFLREHSRLTKRKANTFLPPGFQLSYAGLAVLPLVSRFFSRLSRKLHDPKTIAHSCIRNAFPNGQDERPKLKPCPDPQRISEATNKRAPGSYLNKGSIVSIASSPFSTTMTAISALRISFPKFHFLHFTIPCLLYLSIIQIITLSFYYLLYYTVFRYRVRSIGEETTENLNCLLAQNLRIILGI